MLIIKYMDIQECGVSCTCDHLEIQNSSSFDSLYPISGRRCGRYNYNDNDHYYCHYHDYHYYHCYHSPLKLHSRRESLKVLFHSHGSATKMYSGFKATYVQVNRGAEITGKSETGFLYFM